MTFQWCCPLILLMCIRVLFGRATSSPSTDDIKRHVRAMLESRSTPLVLLLANVLPPSQKEKPCWISEFNQRGPTGAIAHYLYSGSNAHPPTEQWSQRTQGPWLLLDVVGGGTPKLMVDVQSGTLFGHSETEYYDILFANAHCAILKLPTPTKEGLQCMVWVPANTAHFLHTECKREFMQRCPACSRTESTASMTSA
uniref:Lipocalin n=1 Tax=Rhipicephalus zambeziensis TaxID=60191 RepID=A0A224YLG5_9ACAR